MTRKVLRKIIKIGKDFPIEIYDDLVVDYEENWFKEKPEASGDPQERAEKGCIG